MLCWNAQWRVGGCVSVVLPAQPCAQCRHPAAVRVKEVRPYLHDGSLAVSDRQRRAQVLYLRCHVTALPGLWPWGAIHGCPTTTLLQGCKLRMQLRVFSRQAAWGAGRARQAVPGLCQRPRGCGAQTGLQLPDFALRGDEPSLEMLLASALCRQQRRCGNRFGSMHAAAFPCT